MSSILDRFSIGFKLRKDKQRKSKDNNIENQNKLFRTKTYTKKGNLSAQLAQNLISLGYTLDSIMSLMKIHHFSNVEEALNLLEKDPISKLYNHYFMESQNFLKNQDSKSDSALIKIRIENKKEKNKKLYKGDVCRICGGARNEHINEKDEYNKALALDKKKYEKDQYYEGEIISYKNRKEMEKNKIDIKLKAIERVKTLENNFRINKKDNKDNKYLILNLNNNVNKYYINQENKDNSQSPMMSQDRKHKTNTLIILNKQKTIKNQSRFKNISLNNDEHENQESKRQISELVSNSKIEIEKDEDEDIITDDNKNIKKLINQINKDEINNNNEEKDLTSKLGKFGIDLDTINHFKNPDICTICCINNINKDNIAQKCCLHYFCDECIKKYMTYQINNGIVLEIKCIMAGCPHIYTSEEIKENVSNEIYRKYLRFYGIQIKTKNPEKTYINCPFIDCDELVDVTLIQKGNVICGMGHVFCKECRKIGGHSKANSVCNKDELNLDLFSELRKKNPTKIYQNYKQCPECKVLIEKNDGCNEMKCLNCGYVFCWLCLREYTDNHYSIYNIKGCPGMRFETVSIYKIRNNFCLNILWRMLSCFLYIIFFLSIYLFYFFAGCPYEFVSCYLERKRNKDDNKSSNDSIEMYDDNINEFGIGFGNNRDISRIQSSNRNVNNIEDNENKNNKLIIGLLIFAGILCQPLYLAFYCIYTLIECYKRLNCLFFFPS